MRILFYTSIITGSLRLLLQITSAIWEIDYSGLYCWSLAKSGNFIKRLFLSFAKTFGSDKTWGTYSLQIDRGAQFLAYQINKLEHMLK